MPSAAEDAVAPPSRRKSQAPTSSVPPPTRRRSLQLLLVFVTLVLIINALVGERGLTETLRARKKHQELVAAIEHLRTENARLRDDARRLRSDPATIEALARQELGLIKPGEMLFIVKNAKQSLVPNP